MGIYINCLGSKTLWITSVSYPTGSRMHHLTHHLPIRFFGLFTIPSLLYPVFILLVVTILFPNASFWGHLLGMAVGYLYAYGFLRLFVPGAYHFERIEESFIGRPLLRMRRYVKAATDGLVWLPVHTGDIPSNV
jgi:hypothetical protein